MVTKETAWNPARAAALAKTPGAHTHPTVTGFIMRVTPKKSAAYGYHFRDSSKEKKMRNGTYGTVAEAGAGGITLEQALKLQPRNISRSRSKGQECLRSTRRSLNGWRIVKESRQSEQS